jgi:hypothetical protein
MRRRQLAGVCERLTDFVNSGGKRLQGLVNRREEFKAWCLSDPALKGRNESADCRYHVMFVLLIVAASVDVESHKREAEERWQTQPKLKQTGDVLAEVRALRQDVSEVKPD